MELERVESVNSDKEITGIETIDKETRDKENANTETSDKEKRDKENIYAEISKVTKTTRKMACNPMWLVIGVLGVINIIFNIISLVTGDWINGVDGTSYGLWQSCISTGCYDIGNVKPYVWVTRIFLILSIINLIGAALSAMFGTCRESSRAGSGAAGGFFGATVFLIIGMAVYTGQVFEGASYDFKKNFWGWSFALGWVSAALSTILCVVSGLVRCVC